MNREQIRQAGRVGSIGLHLVVSLLIGYFGGRWIDRQLGTTAFALLGLGLGLAAGFKGLYDLAKKASRSSPDDAADPPEPRSGADETPRDATPRDPE